MFAVRTGSDQAGPPYLIDLFTWPG
jgi:hypothetical protein